jgi:hypothetical protein
MSNFCVKWIVPVAIVFAAIAVVGFCRWHSIRMPNPLHASCKIDWTFHAKCCDINTAIADQMKKWESADNCKGGGERCLYNLTSQTSKLITGTHETPVKHYVDDLSFTFVENGIACYVHGYSTSQTWYAVLDYGTNYCNLHNIILGSGLDKTAGYVETTSSGQCTQYSTANCDIY